MTDDDLRRAIRAAHADLGPSPEARDRAARLVLGDRPSTAAGDAARDRRAAAAGDAARDRAPAGPGGRRRQRRRAVPALGLAATLAVVLVAVVAVLGGSGGDGRGLVDEARAALDPGRGILVLQARAVATGGGEVRRATLTSAFDGKGRRHVVVRDRRGRVQADVEVRPGLLRVWVPADDPKRILVQRLPDGVEPPIPFGGAVDGAALRRALPGADVSAERTRDGRAVRDLAFTLPGQAVGADGPVRARLTVDARDGTPVALTTELEVGGTPGRATITYGSPVRLPPSADDRLDLLPHPGATPKLVK